MSAEEEPKRRGRPKSSSRVRMDVRLPDSVVEDCEAMAEEGEGWQDRLRAILDEAKRRRRKIRAPAKGLMKRFCMMVEGDTVEFLTAEADRLTEETGRVWTVAAVVRKYWEMDVDRRE